MRKITLYCCLLLVILSCGRAALAQDAPKAPETPESPAHFYHLVFVIQELGPDGKPTNSRSYTTTVSTDTRDRGMSIRTSSRVPIPTKAGSMYENVGVDIDTHNTREIGHQLSINLTADVRSSATSTDVPVQSLQSSDQIHESITRENKWQATVLIPVGKPTVVFTSDTLDNKGSVQLMLTATPLQ